MKDNPTVKIDFHNHTKYSRDSMTDLKAFVAKSKKLGVIPAITDHDSIDAHKDFRSLGALFIPGEEIGTDKGDLIGLYLNELIPKKTPFLDALDQIRSQGGLAYLPHMFDKTRSGVGIPELAKKVDIIEIFNARSVMKEFNQKAEEFAKANKIPGGAGSDSHFLSEFGTTYTEMPEFDINEPKELMKALKSKSAKIIGKPAPLYVKGTTTVVKFWKKIRKRF
jgi:hypothetical protein